jgi:hypothetical protein
MIRDICKISSFASATGHAGAFCQRIDSCFVQTLSGHPRAFAQSMVDRYRNAANGVLHASIIGSAGISSKHRDVDGSEVP